MVKDQLERRRASIWLPVLLLLATSNPASAQIVEPPRPRSEASDAIERLTAEAVRAGAMPGVSVAVASARGSAFVRHSGAASITPYRPVTDATRFRIGSISKLVTAAAILKLSEEGHFRIDAPAASLLPDSRMAARLPPQVTVEHLLNHTSGLADFTREELEAKVARRVSTDADLRVVLARTPRAAPGEQWAYADAPYRLLSRIVERASGLSFGAYVSNRLAPAIGLPSLALCDPGTTEHAEGFLSEAGKLLPEPAYAIQGLLGEGGLCATAEDLARLPLGLAAGKWLSTKSLARMTAPTRLSDGTIVDYGVGVRGGLLGEHKAWGHTGGGLHGAWAVVAFYPAVGISVAVAANGTGGNVDAATLHGQIAALVLRVRLPRSATLKGAAAFTGTYARGGQTSCLFASGGTLMRTRGGASGPATPLHAQSETVFARLDHPLDRIVFQVEGPTAVAYRVYYDGLFAEYWRKVPGSACAPAAQAR